MSAYDQLSETIRKKLESANFNSIDDLPDMDDKYSWDVLMTACSLTIVEVVGVRKAVKSTVKEGELMNIVAESKSYPTSFAENSFSFFIPSTSCPCCIDFSGLI